MDIRCGRCGRDYEAGLFTRNRVMLCECGSWVEPALRIARRSQSDALAEVELSRRADRITSLILYSDVPMVDIEIEIQALRDYCRRRFPGRVQLFEMIYGSRWKRLRDQGWAHRRDRKD